MKTWNMPLGAFQVMFVLLVFVGARVHGQYVPPTNGLVGWWRAEGNGNDSSGNGHNGTLLNGGGYDAGRIGQAFSFLGNANRLFIPDSPDLNLTNSLSIAAWIYPKANSWHVLERTTSSGFVTYHFSLDNAGRFWFEIHSQSANAELRYPVTFNQWKHVTATLDGASGDMRLYFDGVLVTNRTTSVRSAYADPASQPAMAIGNTPYGGTFPFIGLVDEVVLYSRALSPTEVQGLAQTPPTAPFITMQPASQTNTVGSTTSFTVLAGGTSPLSYQWRFNGTNIIGATSSSLVISNTQFANAGTYAVEVSNSLGSLISSNANLTVIFPTATVRVLSATNNGASTFAIPVVLSANGNETALGFSLNFNTARVSYVTAALGSGASNATLLVNSSQTEVGRLGIALTMSTGETLPPGTQQVVVVNFSAPILTNDVSTPISFGDAPIVRQLSDVNGSALPVTFIGGTITLKANAFEGDVTPRPGGDKLVTVTDWVLIGRFAAQLDYPTNASELQRADCAPRSNLGNGSISVSDWVQAGRYAAGFDPLTPVGGPSANNLSNPVQGPAPNSLGRQVAVADSVIIQGQAGSVPVLLEAQGDENALGFSLSFDPAVFTYKSSRLGSAATNGTFNMNTNQLSSGRIACVMALPSGATFAAGSREVLVISLAPVSKISASNQVSFADQPVEGEVADATATTLPARYVNGTVTIVGPPALRIAQIGTNVTLAWPQWATGFTLQETATPLSPTNAWVNLNVNSGQTNGEHQVTLPLASNPRFYRLYHP